MDYILKERKLFLFVLIISILFLYGSINISYNMYDEGIVVYGQAEYSKGIYRIEISGLCMPLGSFIR